MIKDLAKQIFDTALQLDLPAVSTCECIELLAVTYVLGGSNERFTTAPLAQKIDYCAKRFKIAAGQTPDANIVVKLQQKIKEVEANKKLYAEKYNLKTD